jgi:hypothetical protein
MGVMMATASALFTAGGYPSILAKKGSDSDSGRSDGGGSDSGSSSDKGSDSGSSSDKGSDSGSSDGGGTSGATTGQGRNENSGGSNDQFKIEEPAPNPELQKPTEPGLKRCIPEGFDHNCDPIKKPDQSCAFNPDSPKCKPDPITGKCPPGFSHNVHDNCFPLGPCPHGFGRHDGDESGKCFPTPIHCPPGFFPKHGVCTKDIFINIHNVIHGSSSSSYSLSGGCFDAIKIAWLGKIERSQNQEVDNFIDKCLGVH